MSDCLHFFGLALITVTHTPLPYTHLKRCYATLKLSITNQVIGLMYHDDVRYIDIRKTHCMTKWCLP